VKNFHQHHQEMLLHIFAKVDLRFESKLYQK